MSNKGIKSEAEQLFVFDRWGSFIGRVRCIVDPRKIDENIIICSEKLKKTGRLIGVYEIVSSNLTGANQQR
jgi:hypothetical protein